MPHDAVTVAFRSIITSLGGDPDALMTQAAADMTNRESAPVVACRAVIEALGEDPDTHYAAALAAHPRQDALTTWVYALGLAVEAVVP